MAINLRVGRVLHAKQVASAKRLTDAEQRVYAVFATHFFAHFLSPDEEPHPQLRNFSSPPVLRKVREGDEVIHPRRRERVKSGAARAGPNLAKHLLSPTTETVLLSHRAVSDGHPGLHPIFSPTPGEHCRHRSRLSHPGAGYEALPGSLRDAAPCRSRK